MRVHRTESAGLMIDDEMWMFLVCVGMYVRTYESQQYVVRTSQSRGENASTQDRVCRIDD